MTKIDSTEERNILFRTSGMPQHNQLLVVGATRSHPHVTQNLAADSIDRFTEMSVLLLAERKAVQDASARSNP